MRAGGKQLEKVDPVNVMSVCVQAYLLGLLENSRVYIPSLFTDCLKWSSISVILGSVFLNVAVIQQHDQAIFPRSMSFPKCKQRQQNQRGFVLSAYKL